jgi:NAD(P)-dependent dehydrogenase (short-subunit alcohol dehydrogenase family)
MSLSGRVALVTGAARGIGLGITRSLLGEGAKVVMVDILEEELHRAVRQLNAGGHVSTISIDLTKSDAPAKIRAAVESAFGPAHVLVNNAGIAISGTIEEFTDEQWDRTLAVNVTAPFRMAREFVPRMAANGFGRVINISSMNATLGMRQDTAYAVSKAGVEALTRAIAVDYGRFGVTANTIAPGPIETPLNSDILRNFKGALTQIVVENKPIPGIGTPENIGAAVAYFASDAANFVTGQVLLVDGGLKTTRFVPDVSGTSGTRYLPKN